MRDNGRKLSEVEMRSRAQSGWLTLLDKSPVGAPESKARLMEGGKDLLTPIVCARVKKIDQGGILIVGFLDTSRSEQPTHQAWWCVPEKG